MKNTVFTFKRYEKKYLMTAEQFEALWQALAPHVRPDEYGHSVVCSVYYDTEDFALIRHSLDKPVYKEKLRVRSYGVPDAEGTVFVELKKKFKGVVYKRRIQMTAADAERWLAGEQPPPADDQVRVKVLAAGVNVIDTKIRQGSSFAAKSRGERFPWVIGFDMAGEIVRGRQDFRKGDLVAGLVGFPMDGGAYSSENNFKLTDLVKIPKGCSVKAAGALPLAGLTAYQALFDVGRLRAGESVVISGASGGVGHLAVQLAKKAGARVLAICSEKNFDFVRDLGADEVESYEEDSYMHWQSEADMVLDLIGGQSGINCLSLLKIIPRDEKNEVSLSVLYLDNIGEINSLLDLL